MRGGRESTAELDDDAAVMGLPAEALAPAVGSAAAVDFEVIPENWPTVDLFLRVQTQWRWASTGMSTTPAGLDYNAVDVVMRRMGTPDPEGLVFAGLQVMEVAVLNAAKD